LLVSQYTCGDGWTDGSESSLVVVFADIRFPVSTLVSVFDVQISQTGRRVVRVKLTGVGTLILYLLWYQCCLFMLLLMLLLRLQVAAQIRQRDGKQIAYMRRKCRPCCKVSEEKKKKKKVL